ncbi:MAG TPA: class I SAM-dependent methyltransferase [Anaerolineales bacterium]|nr:class I SAM-dependent methyltransferase [Anaerolineales bacterium]
MQKFTDALLRQFRLNRSRNLLHTDVERLLEIDPTFLAALEDLLADPAAAAALQGDALAEQAAATLVERIYAVNQYIQVDERTRQRLKDIYVASWQELIESRDIEGTLRGFHYPRIQAVLEGLYPPALKEALRRIPTVNEVPCSEYSPALQLQLFRLDPVTLRQPLLDVGCGSRAQLVRYLRSQGVEAHGIDRSLKVTAPYLTEIDWFAYRFEPGRWGTILANLSFTNHFVYAEHYDLGAAKRYPAKYREILESLAPGGNFLYAPNAPLLEAGIVDMESQIERWSISTGHAVTRIETSEV